VDPTSVRLDVADPGSLPPAQAGREVSLSSAGTTLPAAQVCCSPQMHRECLRKWLNFM